MFILLWAANFRLNSAFGKKKKSEYLYSIGNPTEWYVCTNCGVRNWAKDSVIQN